MNAPDPNEIQEFNKLFDRLNSAIGEETPVNTIKDNSVQGYDSMEYLKEQYTGVPNSVTPSQNNFIDMPEQLYVISEGETYSVMKNGNMIAKDFKNKETAHSFKDLIESGYDMNSQKVFNVLLIERKLNKSKSLTESNNWRDKLKKIL